MPEAAASLLRQVVAFVQQLRSVELFKLPGVAESIDWTRALMALGKDELDGATIDFKDTISEQGFTIDNPNATGSCACGDSFN